VTPRRRRRLANVRMLAKPTTEEDPQLKWWNMSLSQPLVPAQALTPSASSNGALLCCS